MDNNIFLTLEKYKPKEITPKENFFTSAVTYLLNTDKRFQIDFIKLLGSKLKNTDEFEAKSQKSYPEYKSYIDIDILIKRNNLVKKQFLIEAKLDSKQGKDQLTKYRDIAEDYNAEVWYITYRYNEVIPNGVKRLTWDKVYNLVSRSKNELTKQFAQYMEKKNMGNYSGLRKGELNWGNSYGEFQDRCLSSLKAVEEFYESKKFKVTADRNNLTTPPGIGLKIEGKNTTFGVGYWVKTNAHNRITYYRDLENGLYLYIWFYKFPKTLINKLNRYEEFYENQKGFKIKKDYNCYIPAKKFIGNTSPKEQGNKILTRIKAITKLLRLI